MGKGRNSNSKCGNRKGYRMRMGKGKYKGSKFEKPKKGGTKVVVETKAEKQERFKKELLRAGEPIRCRGKNNYYPHSVYLFMRNHCLPCGRSFPTPTHQMNHMEEIHEGEGEVVCQRCYQPFAGSTDVDSAHSSIVHSSFGPELN